VLKKTLWVTGGLCGWEKIEHCRGIGAALISKIHHAMVDGVSSVDLTSVLLDRSPNPEQRSKVTWTPEPTPSPVEMVTDAMTELARHPASELRAMLSHFRTPRSALRTIVGGLQAAQRATSGRTATTLNGPVGPNRRYAYTKYALTDIKAIRNKIGGTVNDIVLAAATRGFRDLLVARGEPLDGRVVRVLVPVALHARDAKGMAVHAGDGRYENKATVVSVDLPVSVDDPIERTRMVRQQMETIKASGEIAAGDAISKLSGFAAPTFLASGVRAAAMAPPQTVVNSVVTNVPGPQMPLYAVGRRLLEVFPCPPLFPIGARVAIGVVSYEGTLYFGVLGDYGTTADLGVLRDDIRRGFEELQELVTDTTAQPSAMA
jgi:diacylglycerol O-acyltransferase